MLKQESISTGGGAPPARLAYLLEVDALNLVDHGGAGQTVVVDGEDDAVFKGDDLLVAELDAVQGKGGVEAAAPEVLQQPANHSVLRHVYCTSWFHSGSALGAPATSHNMSYQGEVPLSVFCRFDSRRVGRSRASSASPQAQQPLEPVLSRLVGRPVTLLVGQRFHAGRLLNSNPVILTGPQGQVTVVVDLIKSVAF